MTVTTRKMTAEEFLELSQNDPHERWELVSGEVVVCPRPSHFHMFTAFALARILADHVERHDLGMVYLEVDAVLDEHNVRSPDIVFFKRGRFDGSKRKRVDVVPDLCIEILSPSNAHTDRVEKFNLYQSKGVLHYWITDPHERTLEAYSLQDGRYTDSGRGAGQQSLKLPPFLDLEIPLARLWHP